jgi:hypothetical protein
LGWLLIVIMIGFVSDADPKAAVFLGPIALFPADIITVLLFAASLTRFEQLSKNLRRLGLIIVILVALLMWSTLRGVAIYGVDAFVELRPFFYAAAGVMWSMSIDFDRPTSASECGSSSQRLEQPCRSSFCRGWRAGALRVPPISMLTPTGPIAR